MELYSLANANWLNYFIENEMRDKIKADIEPEEEQEPIFGFQQKFIQRMIHARTHARNAQNNTDWTRLHSKITYLSHSVITSQ